MTGATKSVFSALATVSLLALVAVTASCSPSSEEPDAGDRVSLDVAASAGLRDAFSEIGAAFDEVHGSATSFNLANATVLKEQIAAGAEVDVFASADPRRMDELVQAGLIDEDSVRVFAGNELVLVVPLSSTLDISSFERLADPDIRKIATGDPEATPVGRASLEVLDKLGLTETVQPKLIYTEIVNQAVEYAARGDVDAALVWSSEAQIQNDKVTVTAFASQDWYEQPLFVIGILEKAKHKDIAQAFIGYILGPDGRSALSKYGFLEPPID